MCKHLVNMDIDDINTLNARIEDLEKQNTNLKEYIANSDPSGRLKYRVEWIAKHYSENKKPLFRVIK